MEITINHNGLRVNYKNVQTATRTKNGVIIIYENGDAEMITINDKVTQNDLDSFFKTKKLELVK